jgi:hypothetical protein
MAVEKKSEPSSGVSFLQASSYFMASFLRSATLFTAVLMSFEQFCLKRKAAKKNRLLSFSLGSVLKLNY